MEDAHTDNVTCATFSPDGTRIVSTSYDKMIKVWDAGARSLRRRARPMSPPLLTFFCLAQLLCS